MPDKDTFSKETNIIEFVQRYNNIQKVSLGVPVPKTRNILIDNKKGMQNLTKHLIKVHNIKNIAFIFFSSYNMWCIYLFLQ